MDLPAKSRMRMPTNTLTRFPTEKARCPTNSSAIAKTSSGIAKTSKKDRLPANRKRLPTNSLAIQKASSTRVSLPRKHFFAPTVNNQMATNPLKFRMHNKGRLRLRGLG